MYGDDDGMARKNVRRGERRSSFTPLSVRTRRIIRSARVGWD